MTKSHVTMEQHQCNVCLKTFDTGNLLLDTRLNAARDGMRETFERHTMTGHSLCPEHQKMYDDGFIALVEADGPTKNGRLKPENAKWLGRIAHLKFKIFGEAFNIPLPVGKDKKPLPMVFIDTDAMDAVEKMAA